MTSSEHGQPNQSGTGDQILRGILVVGILLVTPLVVWQFLVPITLAHPLGIVVSSLLVALIGLGLYTIAEGELPSLVRP
ncbi:hypothetical protein [Natrarchaeobaculum aegyptiacum]|uniref:Uncharacterized protein n=1 Tax=Natrarchaeobaculum aegyptiacum TaxID=745377 RepID=A0A2Z2HYM3_9EURY|nr:hypothetical protein [Natrarchaeobaculum aegyptiacum]ARS91485.1 hypothetical protein B1756_18320 [Natrarchaeobaculum aegyptiacum]